MRDKIRVMWVRANKWQPDTVLVDRGDMAMYRSLVGGSLELVTITPAIDMYCNRTGKDDYLPPNFYLLRDGRMVDLVAGDVFFVGHESEEMVSITEEQMQYVKSCFNMDRNRFDLRY